MTANILLVVLFISAIVISILVLLQNKSGDMGSAFGGGSNTLFGARGSADFLTRATSITATVFFLSALALAYIYANQGKQATDSVIQSATTTDQAVEQDAESDIPSADDAASTEQAAEDTAEQTDSTATTNSDDAQAPADEAEDESSVPAVPE